MGKQILIVLGGGRPKGNTVRLVEAFTRGLRPQVIRWRPSL